MEDVEDISPVQLTPLLRQSGHCIPKGSLLQPRKTHVLEQVLPSYPAQLLAEHPNHSLLMPTSLRVDQAGDRLMYRTTNQQPHLQY